MEVMNLHVRKLHEIISNESNEKKTLKSDNSTEEQLTLIGIAFSCAIVKFTPGRATPLLVANDAPFSRFP